MRTIPGGTFDTVLPPAPGSSRSSAVRPSDMDRTPVTNAEFARFVAEHPEWRRDRVARVFADRATCAHWRAPRPSPAPASTAPAGDAGELVRRQGLLRGARRAPAHLVRVGIRDRRGPAPAGCARGSRTGARPSSTGMRDRRRESLPDAGSTRANYLRRPGRARRGVGMGAGPGLDDGVGGQSRAGRSGCSSASAAPAR